jgi:hypothetical protein
MLNSRTIRSFLLLLLFLPNLGYSQAEKKYLKNQSPTYDEVIAFYQALDEKYENAKLLEIGTSDAGLPLHLFVIDYKKEFRPNSKRVIVMVMNGIHGGEPCGVDASMLVAKNMLESGKIPENVVLGIIPVYNIGGALNRNSTTRANQNGPEIHGFRANAKNLDLNRDFIKNDSKNAQSFSKLFHAWRPQLFIDTHTSNGADYQYSFTIIPTLKSKLSPVLQPFLADKIEPYLYKGMKQKGFEMSPYVYPIKDIPDNGIQAFIDLPRYSTGYTALFNTIGFTTEAHMFKSYSTRVEATRAFISLVMSFASKNAEEILQYRRLADRMMVNSLAYEVNWKLNDSLYREIVFKGYEAGYKKSTITNKQRLFYDRNKPFTDTIAFYYSYNSTQKVKRPKYYIIPQAYDDVISRLKNNNVAVKQLRKDSIINVKVFYIESYETTANAYEGHYLHYNVKVREEKEKQQLRKGDYIVSMGQLSDYYTVSVLDPRAADSFFAWNFFDAILQQKEWFSAYVFEDEAVDILNADPQLKAQFDEKKKSDPLFRDDARAQLYFIFQQSGHYEKEHLRYPVFRVD